MLDGERGGLFSAITAVFVCLVLLLVLGLVWDFSKSQTENRVRAENFATAYDIAAEQRISDQCAGLGLSDQAACVREIVGATREYQRSEYDLAAQRDMAKWAFGMILISAASVSITTIGVVYVAMTLREARKTTTAAITSADAALESVQQAKKATKFAEATAEASREAIVSANRAWIIVDASITEPLAFGGDNVSIGVKTTLRNVGGSPATHISIVQEMQPQHC